MFPNATRLLTLRGIDVRADRTLLLIAVLIILSFQSRWSADFGTVPAIAMAVAGTVLFLLSLLFHELGHAFEARHRGIEVKGVTLFLLGGVTEMGQDAKRPRDEFAIAAVGPFLSLVAGAAFGLLATGVDLWWGVPEVEHVLGLLGWLNVGLAIFNMVPGSPLDGGRVLRAALWALTKDRRKAIVLSARAGQAFALAIGVLVVLSLTAGAIGQAVINLLIAWFLWAASAAELRQVALDRLLEGRLVRELDVQAVSVVPADASLATVAAELDVADDDTPAAPASSTADHHGARPVRDADGVVGALVLSRVREVHPQDQPFRLVRDLMTPAAELPRFSGDTPVWDLLRTFQREPLVLVDLDDGTTTTVTSRQFAHALEHFRQRRRALAPPAVHGVDAT